MDDVMRTTVMRTVKRARLDGMHKMFNRIFN